MAKRKRTERQTIVKIKVYRKLKIEWHEPHVKLGMNSDVH